MPKKEIIAMILAGGRGSRLGALTNEMAKPAIPFGSRYRIIDFPLSNCTNSSIDTVGVLTQYQPLTLNTYVGNGNPWDLDRSNGGAFILPPYEQSSGGEWYLNTANAIYQNLPFIESFDPQYVLILSGDHIYKMNYRQMLAKHIEKEADCTIVVIRVPWEETSRFGIMNTDEDSRIIEFEEKPKKAKSDLASMGIYIFSWPQLREALISDDKDPESAHDFGQNIIPKFIDQGLNVYAYEFEGYWKDVGTISSLWESHMDLLDKPEEIDFRDPSWRIYSRNPVKPAHFIGETAEVSKSAMTDGVRIFGHVDHCVLGHSVVVEEGAYVKDSVLMPGSYVKSGAKVERAVVGLEAVIGEDVEINPEFDGTDNPYINDYCSNGITVVNHGVVLKDGVRIPGNAMIDETLENVPEDQNVIADLKQVW